MAATGNQYQARCKEARGNGDVKNVPATRCSRDVFYQILESEGLAVLDHVRTKLINKGNPLKFLCWSEDSSGSWEQCVCRAVWKDRSWEDLLIKWHEHAGKKTGLEKASAVKQNIKEFSGDVPGVKEAVKEAFEKCCRAFLADGESSEPLAAQLVKVEGTLPFQYIGRCNMHSKQKNMENAAESEPLLKELLGMLILNRSDGKIGKELGGLCRAIRNRDRMRMQFHEDVERDLDQLVKDLEELGEVWHGPKKMQTGKHGLCSAPQRFDSLLEGLRSIILSIRAVILFLVKHGSSWSRRLLNLFMSPEFEAALPALAEFMEIGRQYVHRDEGHDPEKSNLINSWANFLDMKMDLQEMFSGDVESNQPPVLASPQYTKGYYQIMQKSLNTLGDDACYRDGKGAVLFHRPRPTEEQEASRLAIVLKKMQHVVEVFLMACEVDLLMAQGAPLLLLSQDLVS